MKTIEKDILTVETGIISHQVNSLGVHGAGLALYLANLYPREMNVYSQRRPEFGNCLLVQIGRPPKDLYIANLVGQMGFGNVDRQTHYGALANALVELNRKISDYNLRHLPVYFPHGIGCGLGGGDWNVVRELLEFFFPQDTICKLPGKK